jgi:AcrR family transcriptional regulator
MLQSLTKTDRPVGILEDWMQVRSQETKARILKTALKLFSEEGYDATGVAEICRAAGVSKGAFYHHFPTKQAVFLKLLEEWVASLSAQMLPISTDSKNVPEALLEMAGMMDQVFADASGRLPVFIEFWRQAHHHPEIWEASVAPYRTFRDYFASLIQRGVDEGSFRTGIDPQAVAQVLVSMAAGLLLQGVLDPHGADWGKTTKDSIHMLLDGILRREP